MTAQTLPDVMVQGICFNYLRAKMSKNTKEAAVLEQAAREKGYRFERGEYNYVLVPLS